MEGQNIETKIRWQYTPNFVTILISFSNLVVDTGIYYCINKYYQVSVIEKNKNNLRTSAPHFGQNLRTPRLVSKIKCLIKKNVLP